MGIVRRYHEALRNHGKVFFLALAKVERYAAQKVAQNVGSRALLGGAAGLLIIKHAAYGYAAALGRVYKALHAAERALHVVQLGGGNVLIIPAEERGGHAVVKVKIVAYYVLCAYAEAVRHHLHEFTLAVFV